jgi:hypothetical protein
LLTEIAFPGRDFLPPSAVEKRDEIKPESDKTFLLPLLHPLLIVKIE